MNQKSLKNLFLIDGFGAIVSAFLLSIVLVYFQEFIGIPKTTLYLLATLPCIFALFDFYCYFKVKENLEKSIKTIAIINILYCFLSIGLAIYHHKIITNWGWIYVIIEVIIVMIIAQIELKTVNKHQLKN